MKNREKMKFHKLSKSSGRWCLIIKFGAAVFAMLLTAPAGCAMEGASDGQTGIEAR